VGASGSVSVEPRSTAVKPGSASARSWAEVSSGKRVAPKDFGVESQAKRMFGVFNSFKRSLDVEAINTKLCGLDKEEERIRAEFEARMVRIRTDRDRLNKELAVAAVMEESMSSIENALSNMKDKLSEIVGESSEMDVSDGLIQDDGHSRERVVSEGNRTIGDNDSVVSELSEGREKEEDRAEENIVGVVSQVSGGVGSLDELSVEEGEVKDEPMAFSKVVSAKPREVTPQRRGGRDKNRRRSF
jgi:hypothetical protein